MMKSRAIEDWQKRDVMEKILKVWMEHPSLRLNQLLINALGRDFDNTLFYLEDYDLVDKVFAFAERYNKKNPID